MECLEYFQGDTIIHVGELAITGTKAGGVQRPWGKTSCSEFQVALMADFHCVVRHRLPSFPTSCDYLTVWKRTPMMITGDSQGEEEEADEEGEDEGWAVIPAEEVLELGDGHVEDPAAGLAKNLRRDLHRVRAPRHAMGLDDGLAAIDFRHRHPRDRRY